MTHYDAVIIGTGTDTTIPPIDGLREAGYGGLGLLADRNAGVLVGAWAVGPLAGEWIQWATLAIRANIPLAVLEDTILAFPTFTRLYLSPLRELKSRL